MFKKVQVPNVPDSKENIDGGKKSDIRSLLALLKFIRRKPTKKWRKRRLRFEARFLKRVVKRAKKSKDGFHFISFDKGLDRLPILFIHKSLAKPSSCSKEGR